MAKHIQLDRQFQSQWIKKKNDQMVSLCIRPFHTFSFEIFLSFSKITRRFSNTMPIYCTTYVEGGLILIRENTKHIALFLVLYKLP